MADVVPQEPAQGADQAPVEESVEVPVRRLDAGLPLPAYAHPGDAGADLHAASECRLGPGERALVPTGLVVAVPEGYVGLVHPRSGLAARHGITVLNAPGTVDAGYRGEVQVCLLNTDRTEEFVVHRGDRIAQLVLQRVATARFVETDDLGESARGIGGYGSTGGFTAGRTGDTAETAETKKDAAT